MRDVSERDWKLFRKKLPGWQEAYMESKASERFWKLEKRITDDRKKTGVIVSMRRSKMIFHIADLVNDGAINMSDIEEFSDDVKTSVRLFLRMEENGH